MKKNIRLNPNNNYNLIIKSGETFSTGKFIIEKNRSFENIKNKFDNFDIDEVLNLPSLFMDEIEPNTEPPVYFGYITSIQEYDEFNYIVWYNIENTFKFSTIKNNLDELDIADTRTKNSEYIYELHRSHWLIKFSELYKTLKIDKNSQLPDKRTETPDKTPKFFLSWSDEKSKRNAKAFKQLLKNVFPDMINDKNIFFSADETSLHQGSDFYGQILNNLSDSSIGIIFVTSNNYNKSSWLNFEAGALKTKLPEATFVVFDGTSLDFQDFIDSGHPLNQIQALYNIKSEQSTYEMLSKINDIQNKTVKVQNSDLSKKYHDERGWESYLNKITKTAYSNDVKNFFNMLCFWTNCVDNLHINKNDRTKVYFDEILPNIKNRQGTVDLISLSGFNTNFVNLNENNKVAIRLYNKTHTGFDTLDHYIAWVPNNPETESSYLNIFYYYDSQKLVIKYNSLKRHNNYDSDTFKTHMKKYSSSKNVYSILRSDLSMESAHFLYHEFLEMIKYSKKESIK